MMIPEKASPLVNVVKRISPGLALSSFVGSNSLDRAPVGSRRASCWLSMTFNGSLQAARSEGGASWMIISRCPAFDQYLMSSKRKEQMRSPLSGRNRGGSCDQKFCGT